MLNIEYYKDEILKEVEYDSTQCVFAKIAGIECGGICKECEKLSVSWLCQEHEEPLLTNEEKKILSDLINALKPFTSSELKVEKRETTYKAYITVCCNENVYLPSFDKDKRFTGLEYNKPYTLEELGLFEKEDE